MRSYTGMDGYLSLMQIRLALHSEFFKNFREDFFQKIKQVQDAKKEDLTEDTIAAAKTIQKLTQNRSGKHSELSSVISNIERAIQPKIDAIKLAALKQKQRGSTLKYGLGLGFALPVLEALFLNDGELPIRLFAFSLVATTAMAACVFYCCSKTIFKHTEFDKATQLLKEHVDNEWASYFTNAIRRGGLGHILRLDLYTQRFNSNPPNSPLPLTMKEIVTQAADLRTEGEAMMVR